MSQSLPESTYRLQFHAGFTFRDAAAIVPYLHASASRTCYASPYLKARPGSTHGYDVIDHCSLNPELGTRGRLRRVGRRDGEARHEPHPRHRPQPRRRRDQRQRLVERRARARPGVAVRASTSTSPGAARRGRSCTTRCCCPCSAGMYGDVLEKGELKLVHEDGKFWVRYYDRRFPLSPETRRRISSPTRLDAAEPRRRPARRAARRPALPPRLLADGVGRDQLPPVLRHQRPRRPRHGARRGLRGDARVHVRADRAGQGRRAPHRPPGRAVRPGAVLPSGLQAKRRRRPLYVVVEKILAPDEPLPEDWPVHGTSGYDFLNMVNGLFVDGGERGRRSRSSTKSGPATRRAFEDLVYEKKRLILEISLASELQMLAHRLDRLAQRGRHSRDFTHRALRDALREVIACFPVYRSYVTARGVQRDRPRARRRQPSSARSRATRRPTPPSSASSATRCSRSIAGGDGPRRTGSRSPASSSSSPPR